MKRRKYWNWYGFIRAWIWSTGWYCRILKISKWQITHFVEKSLEISKLLVCPIFRTEIFVLIFLNNPKLELKNFQISATIVFLAISINFWSKKLITDENTGKFQRNFFYTLASLLVIVHSRIFFVHTKR